MDLDSTMYRPRSAQSNNMLGKHRLRKIWKHCRTLHYRSLIPITQNLRLKKHMLRWKKLLWLWFSTNRKRLRLLVRVLWWQPFPMPSPQGDTAPVVGQAQVQQESNRTSSYGYGWIKVSHSGGWSCWASNCTSTSTTGGREWIASGNWRWSDKGKQDWRIYFAWAWDCCSRTSTSNAGGREGIASGKLTLEWQREARLTTSTLPEPETAAAAPAPAMQEVEKESHQETVGQAAAPAPTVQEPKKDDDDVEAEGDGDDKDSSMSSSTSSDDESEEATGGRIILFFVFNPANIQLHLWLVFFLTRKDLRLRAKRTRLWLNHLARRHVLKQMPWPALRSSMGEWPKQKQRQKQKPQQKLRQSLRPRPRNPRLLAGPKRLLSVTADPCPSPQLWNGSPRLTRCNKTRWLWLDICVFFWIVLFWGYQLSLSHNTT